MNSEQIAEFNREAAEYLGLKPYMIFNNVCYFDENSVSKEFDPYHDANDRNKVLEKMRLYTQPRGYRWKEHNWNCYSSDIPFADCDGDSMEAAQIACIASVLGVNQ